MEKGAVERNRVAGHSEIEAEAAERNRVANHSRIKQGIEEGANGDSSDISISIEE